MKSRQRRRERRHDDELKARHARKRARRRARRKSRQIAVRGWRERVNEFIRAIFGRDEEGEARGPGGKSTEL